MGLATQEMASEVLKERLTEIWSNQSLAIGGKKEETIQILKVFYLWRLLPQKGIIATNKSLKSSSPTFPNRFPAGRLDNRSSSSEELDGVISLS